MARTPPWRWKLLGSWPPSDSSGPLITDNQIKPLAERLSHQRPWASNERNWLDAERATQQRWRSWLINFCGDKERSGWDWTELALKISIPILILALSTDISRKNLESQAANAIDQKEETALRSYLLDMQPLILDRNLRGSSRNSNVRAVARALTLATLNQMESGDRKAHVIQFLLDSGLNNPEGNIISLSRANLRSVNNGSKMIHGANLNNADLSDADLSNAYLPNVTLNKANLKNAVIFNGYWMNASFSDASLVEATVDGAYLAFADLRNADLRGARFVNNYLLRANLSGANLKGANLSNTSFHEADLKDVQWDKHTKWPKSDFIAKARNIPYALRSYLALH
jgi:uncharacterized protein YjbI with pentapeptide repeats